MELSVNESSLNGESVSSRKTHIPVKDFAGTYSPNCIYRGTTVTEGDGIMEVTAVGDATEIGKTARQAAELTGAKTFIGAGDCGMVNGSCHKLTWANEFNTAQPAPFEPDVLLHDGDKIALGNVEIDCIATPGHTPGTFSYFWNVEVDGKTYRAGTFGGAGTNTLKSAYIHKLNLENENWRGAFRNSIARARKEYVDIFIGNHPGQSQTAERYQRLCEGDKFAFVDPQAWGKFLDQCEAKLNKLEIDDPL